MGIISEKKINEAARGYCDATYGTLKEEPFIAEGFRQGAEWAQQECVNSLWHDYTELPDFKQPIVYASKLGYNHISSITIVTSDELSKIKRNHGEFKWAYSKDILPKEYFKE